MTGVREIVADPRANGLSPVIATLADAWALAGAGDIDGGARKLTDAARDMQGLKVLSDAPCRYVGRAGRSRGPCALDV